jgi:hypothetical protein
MTMNRALLSRDLSRVPRGPAGKASLLLAATVAALASASCGSPDEPVGTFGDVIMPDVFDQGVWSADGATLFYISGSVHQLNTSAPAVKRVDIGSADAPRGLDQTFAIYHRLSGPAGDHLWVLGTDVNEAHHSLLRVAVDGSSAAEVIATDVGGLAVTPDRTRVLYLTADGLVVHPAAAADASADTIIPVVCEPILVSPDGQRALCSSHGDLQRPPASPLPATVLDLTTGQVAPIAFSTPIPENDVRTTLRWDASGLWFLWTDITIQQVVARELLSGMTKTVILSPAASYSFEPPVTYAVDGQGLYFWDDKCVAPGDSFGSCGKDVSELYLTSIANDDRQLLARGDEFGTVLPTPDGQQLLIAGRSGTRLRDAR